MAWLHYSMSVITRMIINCTFLTLKTEQENSTSELRTKNWNPTDFVPIWRAYVCVFIWKSVQVVNFLIRFLCSYPSELNQSWFELKVDNACLIQSKLSIIGSMTLALKFIFLIFVLLVHTKNLSRLSSSLLITQPFPTGQYFPSHVHVNHSLSFSIKNRFHVQSLNKCQVQLK